MTIGSIGVDEANWHIVYQSYSVAPAYRRTKRADQYDDFLMDKAYTINRRYRLPVVELVGVCPFENMAFDQAAESQSEKTLVQNQPNLD